MRNRAKKNIALVMSMSLIFTMCACGRQIETSENSVVNPGDEVAVEVESTKTETDTEQNVSVSGIQGDTQGENSSTDIDSKFRGLWTILDEEATPNSDNDGKALIFIPDTHQILAASYDNLDNFDNLINMIDSTIEKQSSYYTYDAFNMIDDKTYLLTNNTTGEKCLIIASPESQKFIIVETIGLNYSVDSDNETINFSLNFNGCDSTHYHFEHDDGLLTLSFDDEDVDDMNLCKWEGGDSVSSDLENILSACEEYLGSELTGEITDIEQLENSTNNIDWAKIEQFNSLPEVKGLWLAGDSDSGTVFVPGKNMIYDVLWAEDTTDIKVTLDEDTGCVNAVTAEGNEHGYYRYTSLEMIDDKYYIAKSDSPGNEYLIIPIKEINKTIGIKCDTGEYKTNFDLDNNKLYILDTISLEASVFDFELNNNTITIKYIETDYPDDVCVDDYGEEEEVTITKVEGSEVIADVIEKALFN